MIHFLDALSHFNITPYPYDWKQHFRYNGTIIWTKRPSWIFIDPQMDRKVDPMPQIIGDSGQIKALQGPFKVQIDNCFYVDL